MADSNFIAIKRQMPLPDGRTALVTGTPHRWDGALPMESATSACLMLLLRAYGSPVASKEEVLSLVDVEEEIHRAGLYVASDPAQSLEDLVQQVELGRTIILFANAGLLWNSPSAFEHAAPNHAILICAVAQDIQSGGLLGVFVCDPSVAAPRFLTADELDMGWLRLGGSMLAVWKSEDERIFSPNL